MIDLTDCTLVCADTRNHQLALRALRLCMDACRFGRVLFLTDQSAEHAGVETVAIPALTSAADYSRLMIKGLREHIDTPLALVVQWDGYVIHPECWQDSFRDYDYIGARWPWLPPGRDVGNGGFSLRSKRLLDALADPDIADIAVEDVAIGQAYRTLLESRHGIRFAPGELADRFSFEVTPPPHPTFGFHALFNFWLTVPDADLPRILAALADANTAAPQLRVLGVNYLVAGRHQAAAVVFRRILEVQPAEPEALRLLKHAESAGSGPLAGRNDVCPCGSGRRFKACHGALGAAISATTAASGGAAGMARIDDALRRHEGGDLASAERLYREILEAEPEHPVAMHFLGVIAYQRKDLATALPLLIRAAALRPEEPNFHNNLALALMDAGRTEEAIAAFEKVLGLAPRQALTWSNLGLARQALNQLAEAIAAFREAIRIDPGFIRARWNLALALLLMGQFEEGWQQYEARLAIHDLAGKEGTIALPRWNGRAEAGLRLQLQAEQGAGDTIQFLRYLPMLEAQGISITLACDSALHPILAALPGRVRLISRGAADPECQAQFPLASLPMHFGTREDSVPADVPYLRSDPARQAQWRERLGPPRALRVGLVWAGNPAHANDQNRSLHLGLLAPLLSLPGIEWFALQLGAARQQLLDLAPALRPRDTAEHLRDYGDTAALLDLLDLVLTVDTSVAHLAGAMARKTWILLPLAPDWRWRLGREDSAWYPSARLFRQLRRGDWSAPLARVAEELKLLAQA